MGVVALDRGVRFGMAVLAAGLALLWVQLLKKFVRPFIFATAALGVVCRRRRFSQRL